MTDGGSEAAAEVEQGAADKGEEGGREARSGSSGERVFKKTSPNSKLTLYLSSRDLVVAEDSVDRLQGVLLVDPEYVDGKKVFGQITLTFRYGREDEEVMGLKFCNEAIMCLAQLYPLPSSGAPSSSPLQEALLKRLGPNAHPFTMEVTPLAPPSVQLVPAKEYSGAPIGTSYDVRAYAAERADERPQRRATVRMGIRVVQRATAPPPPSSSAAAAAAAAATAAEDGEHAWAPHAAVDKPFLLSDGRVSLEASLDKAVYSHGEQVRVRVCVRNNTNKTVRRIKVFVVQHVDVCMFSNGKFKNVVAQVTPRQDCPVASGRSLERTYCLRPAKGSTKNWIALEDSYSKSGTSLASTVAPVRGDGGGGGAPAAPSAERRGEDRNVFAIYVSYYVKVKLLVSVMGGEVSLKLPFTLVHTCPEHEAADPGPAAAACPRDERDRSADGT